MPPHPCDSIVIVGAGIIGLNVALVLAEKGHGRSITVIAEHLPGDTSVTYTSPWAGCNFSALSGSDANALRWDALGYAHLMKLADHHGQEAFVQRTPSTEYWDDHIPHEKIRTMEGYLEDFQILPKEKLPTGINFGVSFTTVTVNAPKHIEYLHRQLETQYGVRFVRQCLPSIHAAYVGPTTQVVFNCVGNAARTLTGAEDSKCFPTRGQVVLVRAPQVRSNIMRHGEGYETYVIPRPESNGNVILGGYMQKGVNDGSTYSYETQSILERTSALNPELINPEVLAVFAGLRPSRQGGARVERGELLVAGKKRDIVHNYGAGGTGFQAGYGMALDAVASVEDILQSIKTPARL
ncbi:hypothetical protein BJX96DRAFT_185172 [Aspergillus floccosus]